MDKKNTILLTVIAVATLLVAMIGATFAYFTAQTGAGKIIPINVTTATSDTTRFGTFGSLLINATDQNFGETSGQAYHSLYAESTGYVSYTASNNTDFQDGKTSDYCYKVGIQVTSNNFDYSLLKTNGDQGDNYPELILRVYKKANVTGDPTDSYSGNDYQEYGQLDTSSFASSLPTSDGNTLTKDSTPSDSVTVPYKQNILTSDKAGATLCLDTAIGTDNDEEKCIKPTGNINGYDITVLGNSDSTSDATFKDKKVILIPSDTDKYEHKISITSKDQLTVNDYWKVQVIFVNYSDTDVYDNEAGSGDQNKNTNKTFDAALVFTPVDKCSGN